MKISRMYDSLYDNREFVLLKHGYWLICRSHIKDYSPEFEEWILKKIELKEDGTTTVTMKIFGEENIISELKTNGIRILEKPEFSASASLHWTFGLYISGAYFMRHEADDYYIDFLGIFNGKENDICGIISFLSDEAFEKSHKNDFPIQIPSRDVVIFLWFNKNSSHKEYTFQNINVFAIAFPNFAPSEENSFVEFIVSTYMYNEFRNPFSTKKFYKYFDILKYQADVDKSY